MQQPLPTAFSIDRLLLPVPRRPFLCTISKLRSIHYPLSHEDVEKEHAPSEHFLEPSSDLLPVLQPQLFDVFSISRTVLAGTKLPLGYKGSQAG